MAKKTWTLTDVDRDEYVEAISLLPEQVGGPATGYSVTKRSLHGGLRQGVDAIEHGHILERREIGMVDDLGGKARAEWTEAQGHGIAPPTR